MTDLLDFVYGDVNGGHMPAGFAMMKDYATLETWSKDDWLALLYR